MRRSREKHFYRGQPCSRVPFPKLQITPPGSLSRLKVLRSVELRRLSVFLTSLGRIPAYRKVIEGTLAARAVVFRGCERNARIFAIGSDNWKGYQSSDATGRT
jgi:hypothetical protein